MENFPSCPQCSSTLTYEMDNLLNCPECGHAWNAEAETAPLKEEEIKDANGNILQDGDSVVVVKDLPVKGFSRPHT